MDKRRLVDVPSFSHFTADLFIEAHYNAWFLKRITFSDEVTYHTLGNGQTQCKDLEPGSSICFSLNTNIRVLRRIYSTYYKWISKAVTFQTHILDARFESRLRHQLYWGFSWFSSILTGKCHNSFLIKTGTLPNKYFPICHSSIILPFARDKEKKIMTWYIID